jgi:glycerate 2-kinase
VPDLRARRHALQIFRAALKAADPQQAVLRHLRCDGHTLAAGGRRYSLSRFDRIQVIGAGKASAAMALVVERLLGRRVSGGAVNVPDGIRTRLKKIELHPSRHPVPDERGVAGAEQILRIAQEATERDLLIAVISGGASALLPAPVDGLTLESKQAVTRSLLGAGATIHEMNAIRKHLSRIKGGRLALAAFPATIIALILSDVVGDDLDVIGSGPTVGDRSTVADARAILAKYGVRAPEALMRETPKPGDARLSNVQNVIVGSNRQAMDAAAAKARELGYRTLVLSSVIEGETREIAMMHAGIAKEVLVSGRPVRRPACILSGGETTVTVRGTGLGGRNQEFVLAAAIALARVPGVTIFSAGTDGIDGPTDAAGAVADESTLSRAAKAGLGLCAHLNDNDSYRFFETLGDLVKTGPTGTNVADVRIMLVH